MSGLYRPPREGVYCTMKKRLLLILLIVGTAGTAVSLFAYGGLVSSTKTCIAASNEYCDSTSGGRSGARYLVNVNCSGQTAVANSQVHWNGCYVKVNDTVTVQFYNWYTPGTVGDNSC